MLVPADSDLARSSVPDAILSALAFTQTRGLTRTELQCFCEVTIGVQATAYFFDHAMRTLRLLFIGDEDVGVELLHTSLAAEIKRVVRHGDPRRRKTLSGLTYMHLMALFQQNRQPSSHSAIVAFRNLLSNLPFLAHWSQTASLADSDLPSVQRGCEEPERIETLLDFLVKGVKGATRASERFEMLRESGLFRNNLEHLDSECKRKVRKIAVLSGRTQELAAEGEQDQQALNELLSLAAGAYHSSIVKQLLDQHADASSRINGRPSAFEQTVLAPDGRLEQAAAVLNAKKIQVLKLMFGTVSCSCRQHGSINSVRGSSLACF